MSKQKIAAYAVEFLRLDGKPYARRVWSDICPSERDACHDVASWKSQGLNARVVKLEEVT